MRKAVRTTAFFLSVLVLGGTFSLFVRCYWLVDIIPPTSKRLLLFSLLIFLVGVGWYFCLLPRLWREGSKWSKNDRLYLFAWSLMAGFLFFFAMTDQWMESTKYVDVFLPVHEMKIQTPDGQAIDALSLTWMRTSFGDVSLHDLSYQGWERVNDHLLMKDLVGNVLYWKGKVGKEIEITFRAKGEGDVILSWDDRDDVLSIHSGVVRYHREFKVPWYASRGILLFFGWLHFSVLSGLLWTVFHTKFHEWATQVKEQVLALPTLSPGKDDWKWVVLLFFSTLALRIFNLESLPPHIEEYAHLNAAKAILTGTPIHAVYSRSLYIVTLPVALFFAVFGVRIWAARLAGVLFNSLAIVPLYLLTRRINRPVAMWAGILYATNPWVIGMARNVREYGYYPFYFYVIAYSMVRFLEIFPEDFVLSRWRELRKGTLITHSSILLVFLVYAYVVDNLSTFKVITAAYFAFILSLLTKFRRGDRWNKVLFAILLIGIAIASFVVALQSSVISLLPPETSLPRERFGFPLHYFFYNPPQQWYYNRLGVIAVVALLVAGNIAVTSRRKNTVPLFLALLFGCSLLPFLFFFTFSYEARFFFHVQVWYIPLLALGLYGIWRFVALTLKGNARMAAVFAIGALAFLNVQQVLYPTFAASPGAMAVTGYRHVDFQQVNSYILQSFQPGDVLLSFYYARYVSFWEEPPFATVHSTRSWASVVRENSHGWIVIDEGHYWVFEDSLPLETFTLDGKRVAYIGKLGDEYVWRWR